MSIIKECKYITLISTILLCSFLLSPFNDDFFNNLYLKSKYYLTYLTTPTINYSNDDYHNNLITHQMLKIDYTFANIDEKTMKKALFNVNFILNEINKKCEITEEQDKEKLFLQCANALVIKYFPYLPSDLVGNYAKQQADCDLYTYLLIDAGKIKNFDFFSVYSPGHAFIAYKKNNGSLRYWETTVNKPVNFLNSIYKVSLVKDYYIPLGEKDIIGHYKIISLNELIYSNKNPNSIYIEKVIKDELKNNSNNSSAKILYHDYNFYFTEEKNKIKLSIQELEDQLDLYNNTFYKIILISRYIEEGHKNKAKEILNNINKFDIFKDDELLELASKIDPSFKYKCHFLFVLCWILYVFSCSLLFYLLVNDIKNYHLKKTSSSYRKELAL